LVSPNQLIAAQFKIEEYSSRSAVGTPSVTIFLEIKDMKPELIQKEYSPIAIESLQPAKEIQNYLLNISINGNASSQLHPEQLDNLRTYFITASNSLLVSPQFPPFQHLCSHETQKSFTILQNIFTPRHTHDPLTIVNPFNSTDPFYSIPTISTNRSLNTRSQMFNLICSKRMVKHISLT
jgi:hypothetical protein